SRRRAAIATGSTCAMSPNGHVSCAAASPRTPTYHLGFTQPRALGRKVSDEFAVPLCRGHHGAVHRFHDERVWWRQAGIDPIKVARRLWKATHRLGQQRSQRWALPQPHGAAASSDPTLKIKERGHQRRKKKPAYRTFQASRAIAAGCSGMTMWRSNTKTRRP